MSTPDAISRDVPLAPPEQEAPSFAEIYAEHASFVWRTMRRLGVRPADVEDMCQEVFVIVHSKLDDFRGGSLRAWLFAIASRVASDYRKRAFVRREATGDSVPELPVAEEQTKALERTEAVVLLDEILGRLDEDKRSVFILFELEQMPMQEVATAVDCPLQTAYTRLHAARAQVNAAIERWRKKGGTRS